MLAVAIVCAAPSRAAEEAAPPDVLSRHDGTTSPHNRRDFSLQALRGAPGAGRLFGSRPSEFPPATPENIALLRKSYDVLLERERTVAEDAAAAEIANSLVRAYCERGDPGEAFHIYMTLCALPDRDERRCAARDLLREHGIEEARDDGNLNF